MQIRIRRNGENHSCSFHSDNALQMKLLWQSGLQRGRANYSNYQSKNDETNRMCSRRNKLFRCKNDTGFPCSSGKQKFCGY